VKNFSVSEMLLVDFVGRAGIKLGAIMSLAILLISGMAGADASFGTLTVRGEAGPSQIFRQVKAARCSGIIRSCSNVEYFDLNTPKTLIPGQYILGFENSIYPGWVVIRAGENLSLDLIKIQAPANLTKEAKLRVFRDYDSEVERKKLFFVQFYMARPLFRLAQYDFGDLYLASPGMTDVTLRLNYDICNSFKNKNSENEEAVEICLAAAQAKGWRDMSVLYKFQGKDHMERELQKGHYLQNLVSEAGDRRQILMRRQLVSAPIRGTDFVSVFPGQYRFLSDTKSAVSQSVQAGPIFEKFD
jgi:hypothetical protein